MELNINSDIEEITTRYCSWCNKTRHISEFDANQVKCKKCRKISRDELAKKNMENPMPEDYEKTCNKCGGKFNAKQNFQKDVSRPDGYSLSCKICYSKHSRGISITPKTTLINATNNFRINLLQTVLKSVKDYNRSIVRQLCEDFKHEGQPISFAGREWQIEILNDMSPHVVFRKPSQTGLTWTFERFIMCLLMRYNDRPYEYINDFGNKETRYLEAIYSFETKDKASNWSKVRLEKVKNDNEHIRDALRKGNTDQALLMHFGRTALYLVGRSTISGVLSISADIVIIDEKDRDQNPDISNQIGSRTLESPFMNTPSTKGLTRETSTPEVSGAGISLQYEQSNKKEWQIKCVYCDTWQTLSYPESIANFYEKGDEPKKDKNDKKMQPYWKCMNCSKKIDWKTIGNWNIEDPDYYENCRWVITEPDKYNKETGEGIVGYQIPFASARRPAPFILAERDNPERTEAYLYNHLLGFPFDDISKTLVPDNFHPIHDITWGYTQDSTHVLGCDHHPTQGGFIVIWKLIKGTQKPSNPEGKWYVAFMEHVKNNRDLWDAIETIGGEDTLKRGRLYELMIEYNIEIAVLDVEPDTNEVEKLIEEFSFEKKIWGDKSGAFQETFKYVEEQPMEDGSVKPVCKIYEDKVAAIDWYFNKIRFGDLLFIEGLLGNPAKYMEDFKKSHMNLYKGEVVARAGVGEKLAAQNVKETYKKKIKRIGDHWVMASKFCAQATRVLVKANRKISGIIPPAIKGFGRMKGI